jgi:hypothetical protein
MFSLLDAEPRHVDTVSSMSDVHVLPIGDLQAHQETRDCWCKPSARVSR